MERLARLAVEFGANVQPGQIVSISTEPGKEELTRAIAEAAYERGARFVDPWWFDPHVKRSRLRHADPETLSFVPEWHGRRLLELGEVGAAAIALSGLVEPNLMSGIDPALLALDMLPQLKESGPLVEGRRVNWTVVPCPTPGWAAQVYPGVAADEALRRLGEAVADICRLSETDPVAAWEARLAQLDAVRERLNALALDSVRFEGPGTDLTVGLLGGSRWTVARFSTLDGVVHTVNLPTEEVFTTPDPARTEGTVTSTKPLFVSNQLITGLRVRFEHGRAVEIEADQGADTLRGLIGRDADASRLGELALVDGDSRVGRSETVFFDTLLDENAASHIALGQAYGLCIEGEEDLAQINESEIHVDFMIGGDDVAVTGMRRDGEVVPLLRGGRWQI